MLDLMAGNDELSRRLGAYGLARLSPDLATTSRMRARVLAVAHRRAALTRADAGLAVLHGPADEAIAPIDGTERPPARSRGRERLGRRFVAASMAAMLALAVVGGTVFAARAGGPLYETRLWIEEVTLPGGSSERAVAELGRLRDRLSEVGEATNAGDTQGATAALVAYGTILDEASAEAIDAGDAVAAAAIEAGVARNVAILEGLAQRLPATAAEAVSRAVDRAIERSAGALESIDRSTRSGGGGNPNPAGAGGTSSHRPAAPGKSAAPNRGPGPTTDPTPAATPQRTPKPGKTPPAGGTKPTPKPAPTKPPQPDHTPHGAGGGN